jgi:hypothetical protein
MLGEDAEPKIYGLVGGSFVARCTRNPRVAHLARLMHPAPPPHGTLEGTLEA